MYKTIRPSFYDDFVCIADKCRHSCCKGWEIDIDPDTAEYYDMMPGELGEEIRSNIFYDEEGCHFRLKEDRCPFLEKSGLCKLIREMGEDVLCDICALHPRFCFEVKETEFEGLGLCCEGVCDLLIKEDKEPLFTCDNGSFITLSDIIKYLNIPGIKDEELQFTPHIDPYYYGDMIDTYSELESINEEWDIVIQTLKENLPGLCDLAKKHIKKYRKDVFQRFFSYILYRQLELLYDDSFCPGSDNSNKAVSLLSVDHLEQRLRILISYAYTAADFIFMTDALLGDTAERMRQWSEEVEYSTENVGILIQNSERILTLTDRTTMKGIDPEQLL
ncbi:MAG: flagellin lysine-N-methylase [Lachnospiraceae bacterium]|nr:flagellin lysine-N-methylase [Lachnospiraceae bacterium]